MKITNYTKTSTGGITTSALYIAVANGTGFTKDDILRKVETRDPLTGLVIATFWKNEETGAVLTTLPTVPTEAVLNEGPEILLSTETLAVSSTALGFATIPAKANRATVRVLDGEVSWTVSGTPTDTLGIFENEGNYFELFYKDLSGFKAIRKGSTDARLYITYYRVFNI